MPSDSGGAAAGAGAASGNGDPSRTDGAARPADVAERVLEAVRRRSTDAEVEVVVRLGQSALTRFANSFIHQNVAEDASTVSLRVALDGRVAGARLDSRPTPELVEQLADRAIDAARVRPVDPDWPGLAPAEPAPDVDHWDAATAGATPRERAQRVADFIAAAGGLQTAGYCSTDSATVAFANTAGQRLAGRATTAIQDGIARTPTSDASARLAAAGLRSIDGAHVGRLAAERARTSADPIDLEPGSYEVVLDRDAVVDLLQFLFVYGFNGRALEEGRSFVRLGERQLDESISIRDDATDPRQIGVAFDAEGTPKRRVDVVRDGVSTAVLHTRRTAAKAGATSTGHAIADAEGWGALPENLILEPGPHSIDELIGGVDRGLLVNDFWYTRILDPRTTVVTGLTRNGLWLIEGGRIAAPVRNLRFTQSYAEAVGPGRVLGVGSDQALLPSSFELGGTLVPPLHLAAWNFTGGARG